MLSNCVLRIISVPSQRWGRNLRPQYQLILQACVSTQQQRVYAKVMEASKAFEVIEEKAKHKYKKLGLDDLRTLLMNCREKSDLELARKAVNLYQKKGNDFAFEHCSLFIKTCNKFGEPKVAADVICQTGHRLGAWVSLRSITYLIKELADRGEYATIIDLFITVAMKDPKRFNTYSYFEMLLVHASQGNSSELHEFALGRAAKHLGSDAVERLKTAYPAPATKVEGESVATAIN